MITELNEFKKAFVIEKKRIEKEQSKKSVKIQNTLRFRPNEAKAAQVAPLNTEMA